MPKTLLLLLSSTLLFTSCGLIDLLLYDQMIKPTETWYFTKGFDKTIDTSEIQSVLSDSSNITSKAIRLDRRNNENIVSYWIDCDTTYKREGEIRIKIIDKNGYLLRYLYVTLEPETSAPIEMNNLQLVEGKKGNITARLNNETHRLFHPGDMMGLHHFDFKMPENIATKISLQQDFHMYDYDFSWLAYGKHLDEYHLFYEYSYQGELVDSFFTTTTSNTFNLAANHFIQFYRYQDKEHIQITNRGENFYFTIDPDPFGGYGVDKKLSFTNPLLHSFTKNGYIQKFLGSISFGDTVRVWDDFRNESTLTTLHNTLRSIGYSSFISHDEFHEKKYGIRGEYFVNFDLGYSLADINDSLIYYYKRTSPCDYYREFWERRKAEKMDAMVYQILTEVQSHYQNKTLKIPIRGVNDTLKTLFNFDLAYQKSSNNNQKERIIKDYHAYLNKIGLELSAYNMIFLCKELDTLNLERQKLQGPEIPQNQGQYIHGKKYFLNKNEPIWVKKNVF